MNPVKFEKRPMRKERRIIFLKFLLLYFISVVSVFTIFHTYNSNAAKKESENNEALLKSTELISSYLTQLTELNKKSLISLKDSPIDEEREADLSARKMFMDSVHRRIDSISKAGRKYNGISQTRLNYSLLQFQQAFENLETVNKYFLSTSSTDTTALANLSKQLRLKESQIAILEDRLKASEKKIKAPRADLRGEQEEIKFLKWAVRSQVATIKTLEEKLKTLK